MARIVDWPGRIAFSLGAGALITLLLEFSGRHGTHTATRFYDGARAGAMALVIFGGAMLTVSWGQRRWRELGRNREKRRAIRLATLMAHADPVKTQVEKNEERIEQIAAGQVATAAQVRAMKMAYDGMVGALEGYLAKHGFPVAEDLQETTEMRVPLSLVAKDGKLLSEQERDSA